MQQREDVVREHDRAVVELLVGPHQKFHHHVLDGVAHPQALAERGGVGLQVLAAGGGEVWGYWKLITVIIVVMIISESKSDSDSNDGDSDSIVVMI